MKRLLIARRNQWDVVRYYFKDHEQNFWCNCHWHVAWSFFLLWRSSPQSKLQVTCEWIENSTDIVLEVLEYRNIIPDKVASWCVHIDDADMFSVLFEFEFDGDFRNRKAFALLPISMNFQNYAVFEFWRRFLDVVRSSVLGNLICRTLTLSDTLQYLWMMFFNCADKMKPLL